MNYIKLFWKAECRPHILLAAASAVLCVAADFFAAYSAGTALSAFCGDAWNPQIFVAAISFWALTHALLYFSANKSIERIVYFLKRRTLLWFLKQGGDGETAKTLCAFGISQQMWFFIHRYLSVWMTALSLGFCLVFFFFSEPLCAIALVCWSAVYLTLCFFLSNISSRKQRNYGKTYTEEMDVQYDLLRDADGVRNRGQQRYVVSRLIRLWRKFRKEELSLYRVFSATRLGSLALTVLGSFLFYIGLCTEVLSAKALGILLYTSLLLLPSLRRLFRRGPWIEKSKQTCAQLLIIADGEAAK